MKLLVSGASIAGPTLAYWLSRNGFNVTVVERSPALRKAGGHAVDLFKPAMDIAEKMGVLAEVEAKATGTEVDLSQILYDACRDHVDFRFGESITRIAEDTDGVDIAFESGSSERFDLLIGADGSHSNVRRLVFGPESEFATWIGAYLAVASVPNYLELRDRTVMTCGVDRMAGLYSDAQMGDARAIFIPAPP